jgi:hypothetical protein
VVLNTFAAKARLIVEATTTTTTRTEKNHIAVKFHVGHGGPHRDHDRGQICMTIKHTDHSNHQCSANPTTMILEPRACDFVTNKATATLLQTVTFPERGCSLVKLVNARTAQQQRLIERSSAARVASRKTARGLFSLGQTAASWPWSSHSAKRRLISRVELSTKPAHWGFGQKKQAQLRRTVLNLTFCFGGFFARATFLDSKI